MTFYVESRGRFWLLNGRQMNRVLRDIKWRREWDLDMFGKRVASLPEWVLEAVRIDEITPAEAAKLLDERLPTDKEVEAKQNPAARREAAVMRILRKRGVIK
jgi:hypothetical protein